MADWKLATWVVGAALVLAALVPDFSHGIFSILVIQVVVPLAIAGPVARAVLARRLRTLTGIGLGVAGVAIHSVASAALYRRSAGYVAFHDGLTIPILWASALFKVLVVMVIFSIGWALGRRTTDTHPSSSGS